MVSFLDIVLKGYGQILLCSNATTGLSLLLTLLFLSPQVGLLTMVGVAASTLAARVMKVNLPYLHSGCYGFNGVVLGIAWPFLFQINVLTVMMFFFIAWGSSVLLDYLMGRSFRTADNLPVFSIPSLVLMWLMYVLVVYIPSFQMWQGPAASMVSYREDFQCQVLSLYNKQWTPAVLMMYGETFKTHVLMAALLATGIGQHSRLSAFVGIAATVVTVVAVLGIGGLNEIGNIDEYLFNTVPCALVLGGVFVCLNRQVWVMIMVNLVVMVYVIYHVIHATDFPIFVLPFNLFTIFSLWLIKANVLTSKDGFYAVPMDLIFNPKSAERWRDSEIYAQNFWKDIEHSWGAQNPGRSL